MSVGVGLTVISAKVEIESPLYINATGGAAADPDTNFIQILGPITVYIPIFARQLTVIVGNELTPVTVSK